MAVLTVFSFQTGDSFAHRLDLRFKLVLTVMISLSLVYAGPPGLSAASAVFLLLAAHLRIPFVGVIKELRYFSILLALVLAARALSTAGEPLVDFRFLSVSKEGVRDGLLVCWRLMLVVWLGLIFVSSSHVSRIKKAVEWFLAPLPRVPARRVATMLGLVVRFIPLIFAKAGEVAEAQKSRGAETIRNPLTRTRRLVLPMVRGVFRDADNVAAAMAARCYAEDVNRPHPASRPRDWLVLALGASLSLAFFLL